MGTSRNSRASPALQPGWLAIDDRTPRQLLAQVERTAALFRYFDLTNRRHGYWNAFFEQVPVIRYAVMAEIDVAGLGQLITAELAGIGTKMDPAKVGDQAAAWTVIDRLLSLYQLVDLTARRLSDTPSEANYAGIIRQAIEGPLRQDCHAVLRCRKWLIEQAPGAADLATDRASISELNPSWWRVADFDPSEPAVTPDAFVPILQGAAKSTLATVSQLVQSAAIWFQQRFDSPSGLPPHFALYLMFIRQFSGAQQAINRIPARHCEFFYHEVLKLRHAGPEPDQTWVAFTAAPATTTAVPAGTALSAGKDPAGVPIVYRTRSDISVTPSTVTQFATVYLAEPSAEATGFYAAPRANSADGNGAPLAPGASWATFGEDQAGRPPASRTMADAQIGFAITSPVLDLEGGRRVIELIIGYDRPAGALTASPSPMPWPPVRPGTVDYSTANGWTTVPEAQVTYTPNHRRNAKGEVVPLHVALTVTLMPADPALVNGDPKALGVTFDPRTPVLRIRFANPRCAFSHDPAVNEAFLGAAIKGTTVRVTTSGMSPGMMVGAGITLAAGKPAAIFGSPVQPSAEFLVGSIELFRKPVTFLRLSLDWIGLPKAKNGLSDYYQEYVAALKLPSTAFDNNQYRVLVSGRFDGAWQRIGRKPIQPTPTDLAGEWNGEFLFRWWGDPPPDPIPATGTLSPTRSWTADLVALRRNWRPTPGFAGPLDPGPKGATGFVSVGLLAPDTLFGQSLYPQVVTKVALDNALAIATASKPPPPAPTPSTISPAAAFNLLRSKPVTSAWKKATNWIRRRFGGSASNDYHFNANLKPAMVAAGGFTEDVIAAITQVGMYQNQTFDSVVAFVAQDPPVTFSDYDDLETQLGWWLGAWWEPYTPEVEKALDLIIGWMGWLLYPPPDVPKPKLEPMPNLPLTPTALNVRVDYRAQTRVTLPRAPTGSGVPAGPAPWNRVWQISPLAVYPTPAGGSLLPGLAGGGTLYLGIANLSPPETLSLLCLLQDAPVSAGDPKPPRWSWLVGDTWHRKTSDIHDDTEGFLRTGIARIDLPAQADTQHTHMPNGLVWLRVEVADPAMRLRTVQVIPHATLAAWQPPVGANHQALTAHFAPPLPAGSITAFATPRPNIATVTQPRPGFGGAPPETEEEFATRVSERLRHKGRAVTARDYERLLLQLCPEVFFARAALVTRPDGSRCVTLVVLPTLTSVPPAPPPGFTSGELKRMKTLLERIAPLSATLKVINPRYEEVEVTATVKFVAGRSVDYNRARLSEDLKAFISPWIYDQRSVTDPVRSFHQSDFSAFIANRPYVTEVSSCSAQILPAAGPGSATVLDLLTPTPPFSLLISAPAHAIS